MVPEAALVLVALRGEEARVRTSRTGAGGHGMAWHLAMLVELVA